MKRQSVSLVIREMEINAAVSYHPASIRKTSNEKKKKNRKQVLVRLWRNWNLCAGGNVKRRSCRNQYGGSSKN